MNNRSVLASVIHVLSCAAGWLVSVVFFVSTPVGAALQDEIQVYTDEINQPGEYGVEWHMNSTPSGLSTPSYAGEITSHHGLRITPEFSRGLTKTVELGLYVPTAFSSGGTFYAPGLKARVKWLPIQSQDTGGFFAGVNLELSQVSQRFSPSARNAEIRNILGWRNEDWLVSINPIFGLALSSGAAHTPGLEIATKINRKVAAGWSVGWERYHDRGPYNRFLPYPEQTLVNYLVLDHEGQHFDLNFGIGRGQTTSSDHWTVKAIVGFPLGD
jgi:hypothetical protein